MTFTLEAKSIMNEKSLIKYPKLCATAKPILLAFPSSYMVESGFSHAHYSLSKHRSTLNVKNGDLLLKLTNLQTNIHDFLSAHQTHSSH